MAVIKTRHVLCVIIWIGNLLALTINEPLKRKGLAKKKRKCMILLSNIIEIIQKHLTI